MSSHPQSLNRRQFDVDEIVFRAGDAADAAYVIERGCVEILVGEEGSWQRIALLGEGTLVGEIALLDGKPRTATVRAVEPTSLVPIYRNQVESLLAQADPVLQYLMRVLLERFRRTGERSMAASPETGPAESAIGRDAADPLQQLHAGVMRSFTLAQGLAQAFDGDQLELHYQPIIHLDSHRLAGYEALIRWRHPALGMVRPDEFVPLAEKTDLVHRLGEFVLGRAIRDWPALRTHCRVDAGTRPFISVNLSAPELCQPGIVEQIRTRVAVGAMDPAELRIELTETSIISNTEVVTDVIQRLMAMGVSLALDDFGKGYSGLDYLQSLPFSCLKIDKSFIDRMAVSERSEQIIRTALQLAGTLGMSSVAEGIEDAATGERLAELGCVYAQGYHFARPMPVTAIDAWARGFSERTPRATSASDPAPDRAP